jgi:hypothetical protein
MLRKFITCIVLATMMSTLHADEERHEFDAFLQIPFYADAHGVRVMTLRFTAPPAARSLRWRLALLPRHDETVVRSWRGARTVSGEPVAVTVRWRENAPKGVYRMKLWASLDGGGEIAQDWPLAVGAASASTVSGAPPSLAAAIPPATPMASAALYDIYLGNLHSQTNHSDGGGALDQFSGAQEPQHGAFGPSDAYAYAQQHGLDFLMTSEHNHMFDGSDGTNRDADAGVVHAVFQEGLRQAAQWRTSHAPFLALYGQEWGVIGHGGHINVINADALLGWERNAEGALLADEETPKSDYQTLYQHLRQHHWFGQFNHPQRDQFAINGQPLAWSADGDASMLLCEVMNSNAYSTSTDENEPRRSNFEAGCNALLEAGYHLGFSSNQDNHCTNWGAAYSNRTAVLLPRNMPLTPTSLLDALRARRTYARMDKHSLTPLPGEHFYYARVTQDDGKMLWSAPVWITQLPR